MLPSAPKPNDPAWYMMGDLKKRRYSDATWVPLRRSIHRKVGKYGFVGFVEEFEGVGTVAFPNKVKDEKIFRLEWSDIGLRSTASYAFPTSYKPCDVYQNYDEQDLGIDLVIVQHIGNGEPAVWHLNQDLIVALRLKLEEDEWVLPEEGYVPVARQIRDESGEVHSIEIRSEYLKDYLAARHMSLRLTSFRSRRAILADASHIPWENEDSQEDLEDGIYKAFVRPIHEGGMSFGGKAALFKVFHKDFDNEVDAPILPSSDNLESESWQRDYDGQKLYDVMGEMWKNEWLDGGDFSPRVRGDEPKNHLHYITEPSGKTESSQTLNDEDVGKWLWFSPNVIEAVLAVRGARLSWHTRFTGNLELVKYYGVHFGINDLDLVVAYAYDIAKLPMWQQKIWAAHNVSPAGGIGEELAASQVRADPAGTFAAEKAIPKLIEQVNKSSLQRWNGPMFREHAAIETILTGIHRFRATTQDGLLRLAKDIARITADNLNVTLLNSVAPNTGDKPRGSLKTLEAALTTIVGKEVAHRVVAPLFVSYDLRHGDAHLPSSELRKTLEILDIDTSMSSLRQGHVLLERLADCLYNINRILNEDASSAASETEHS